MSSLTSFLKLFKWDTKTDGSQKFNIDKTLNENWDKLDTYLENLEIGGRNLLLNSKQAISNSTYNIVNYTLAEKPVDGQEYTVSLKGNLGEGKTAFRIYNSGGSVMLGTLKYDENKNIHKLTFTWKSTNGSTTVNNTTINVYVLDKSVTAESSIQWIKLEKGNKATDWTPAPEDIEGAIGTLSSLTTVNKTSLVNALNELRLQAFTYLRGNNIGYTTILTNKTFDDAMNLGYSTIFTINGNDETTNGAGFPTDEEGNKAYHYGLLMTYYASSNYALTQIYIPDGRGEFWWRTRAGGKWNCIKQQKITTGTEFATDEYIDNKRVYRKRVNCGALPNASAKNIAHGLSNFNLVKANGNAKNSNGTNLILPYSAPNGIEYSVALSVNNTNIQISTGSDRSAYTECYVDLYYTKN